MKKRTCRFASLVLALVVASAAAKASETDADTAFASLDGRVERARETWQIPGMSLAVVEAGRALHVRGYCVRSLEAGGSVDADTLFMIGSVSKSISAAVLATYADAGRLRWDDRVVDHLPGFRLSDPWVGAETRIEDVLSHRVGVEANDWMDDVPGLDWNESVRRLRYLPQARPFRSAFLYDNFMYSVGGLVVAALDGDYADAARSRLFEPAGMRRTVADMERVLDPRGVAPCTECEIPGGGMPPGQALRGIDNVALPHAMYDGRVQLVSWRHQSSVSAGSALSSAADLGRYLRVLLGGGRIDGRQVLSADAVAELHKPRIYVGGRRNVAPLPGFEEAQRRIAGIEQAYALGWSLGEYAGAKIVHHGGAMLGGSAQVALLPERGIGIAVAANQRLYSGAATASMLYEALDRALELAPVDWIGYFQAMEARAAASSAAIANPGPRADGRWADAAPAGEYCHLAYGKVRIRAQEGAWRVDQGAGREGRLFRLADGRYELRWLGPRNEPRPVDFEFDGRGRPLAIRITQVRFPVCAARPDDVQE